MSEGYRRRDGTDNGISGEKSRRIRSIVLRGVVKPTTETEPVRARNSIDIPACRKANGLGGMDGVIFEGTNCTILR
jgi:hypothetical protein